MKSSHKSIGSETTFLQNSRDDTLIIDKLLIENATAFTDLAKKQKLARTP
ncbi:hypothetical protein [Faucicola boevrei]|nr:hypothetical protein [Moraxella boevrei]